jgi:hypothetical protein
MRPWHRFWQLLPRHCQIEPLLGCDQVVMAIFADVELHPFDLTGEGVAGRAAADIGEVAGVTVDELQRVVAVLIDGRGPSAPTARCAGPPPTRNTAYPRSVFGIAVSAGV